MSIARGTGYRAQECTSRVGKMPFPKTSTVMWPSPRPQYPMMEPSPTTEAALPIQSRCPRHDALLRAGVPRIDQVREARGGVPRSRVPARTRASRSSAVEWRPTLRTWERSSLTLHVSLSTWKTVVVDTQVRRATSKIVAKMFSFTLRGASSWGWPDAMDTGQHHLGGVRVGSAECRKRLRQA